MTRPTNICIFCGSKAELTKEHFFGQWLKDHPGAKTDTKTLHYVSLSFYEKNTGIQTPFTEGRGKLNRNGSPHSIQLKIVCAKCNNGWMSHIQNNAKQQMLNLHDGNWSNINTTGLKSIAIWATMATMCIEFADLRTLVTPPKERRFLKETGNIPANWQIYLGSADTNVCPGCFLHRGFKLTKYDNISYSYDSQTTTIIFGKVFIHAVSAPKECLPPPHLYAEQLLLRQIWPLPESTPDKPVALDNKLINFVHTYLSLSATSLFSAA